MAVRTQLCEAAIRLQGWGRDHARGCWKRVSPLYKAGVFPIVKCKVASRFPFLTSSTLLVRRVTKGPGGYLPSALSLLLFN